MKLWLCIVTVLILNIATVFLSRIIGNSLINGDTITVIFSLIMSLVVFFVLAAIIFKLQADTHGVQFHPILFMALNLLIGMFIFMHNWMPRVNGWGETLNATVGLWVSLIAIFIIIFIEIWLMLEFEELNDRITAKKIC